MVTADLPAFARTGSRIDVLLSSIGDAENLQGGTLLFTPLKAANGQVYAVAQELKWTAPLSGISIDAAVSTGKKSFRENILFTHRGLSGPAILQASSYWTPGTPVSYNFV